MSLVASLLLAFTTFLIASLTSCNSPKIGNAVVIDRKQYQKIDTLGRNHFPVVCVTLTNYSLKKKESNKRKEKYLYTISTIQIDTLASPLTLIPTSTEYDSIDITYPLSPDIISDSGAVTLEVRLFEKHHCSVFKKDSLELLDSQKIVLPYASKLYQTDTTELDSLIGSSSLPFRSDLTIENIRLIVEGEERSRIDFNEETTIKFAIQNWRDTVDNTNLMVTVSGDSSLFLLSKCPCIIVDSIEALKAVVLSSCRLTLLPTPSKKYCFTINIVRESDRVLIISQEYCFNKNQ